MFYEIAAIMTARSAAHSRVDPLVTCIHLSRTPIGEVALMKRAVSIRGRIQRNKFFFPLRVNNIRIANVVLDTGAFDFVLSERIAAKLGLQRRGNLLVRGVAGTTKAWQSRCNLTIGNQSFHHIPCVVMKGLPYEALFGLRFFIKYKYQLLLDPATQTMHLLR